jgi:hypothetical protein
MRRAGLILGVTAVLAATAALAQPAPPKSIDDVLAEAVEAGTTQPAQPAQPDPPPPPQTTPAQDLAYDTRIRASMASAQGFQGQLDGAWVLSAADGDLFALQLADRGKGVVEGAWRDLRRPGALGSSGFVEQIERVGTELTLRFAEGRVATLQGSADGRWRGELTEAGQTRPVDLKRRP